MSSEIACPPWRETISDYCRFLIPNSDAGAPRSLAPTLVVCASAARTLLCRSSHSLHCISAAPAALDRYLAALPAMSLIPFAPLYLSCFPQRSTATSRRCQPCRSSHSPHSYFLILNFTS